MIKVLGDKEIKAALKGMGQVMSHKVIGSANLSAAKPLIEREKLLAPEGPTGNLVDSIGGIRVSLKKSSVVGEVNVGPRRGGKNRGYAAHLVEYGTVKRRLKSNGANRGVMPKKPFAKPAFEQTQDQVEKRIASELSKKITAQLNKNVK